MDEEIKRKLEEMSAEHNSKYRYARGIQAHEYSYMAGAQAAWTLAVEWERERIKNVIESAGKYTNGLHNSIFNTILTPEEVKSE